ncbi:hypothetical protein O185_09985 [Photorhabdus temperata J3]|uniref:Uncharacterized protein n=1 Tax=Photorhabdus temperata J3 TaxID=1389415 RepID=U7QYR6_PHOTE|nr:hypothetical protein O185_09985 [Photorhabdus temperata J3]
MFKWYRMTKNGLFPVMFNAFIGDVIPPRLDFMSPFNQTNKLNAG